MKLLASYPAEDTRAHLKAERDASERRDQGTDAHVTYDRDRDDFQVVTDEQPNG